MSSSPPPPPEFPESPHPQDRPAGGSWEQPPAAGPAYQGPYAPPTSGDHLAFRPSGPTLEHPHATLAFVLGLLGALGVLVLGPFGWYYGRKVVREIDRDPRPYGNRGLAVAGMWLGVVGTVFLLFVVGVVVLAIVLAVVAAGTSR